MNDLELPERPGSITRAWLIQCSICLRTHTVRFEYDEASMWLTSHLDQQHPGWTEPLPERPGYYAVGHRDPDLGPAVVELLESPAGQWVDAGDRNYLEEEQIRGLMPLRRLVIAGQVRPEDLDMVESDDFITGLIDENRQLQQRLNELKAPE